MMTHQSPDEKNPPPHQDMCHSPAEAPAFFVVNSPPGDNDKAPICCWDADLSLSELSLHSASLFVRRADHVSLLTPLCSTVATGKMVPLFSSETSWKYNRLLFSKALASFPW